jgi:hypothetical protein
MDYEVLDVHILVKHYQEHELPDILVHPTKLCGSRVYWNLAQGLSRYITRRRLSRAARNYALRKSSNKALI